MRHRTVNERFKRLARDRELRDSTKLFDAFLDSLPAISSGELSLDPLKEIPFSFDTKIGLSDD